MIFKELINSVNYDDVWQVLDKEYEHEDGAYEAYKNVLEELKILEPEPCEPPITLVVARIEECLKAGEFIFTVFGMIKDDENHYALEMTSWNEWLNFNVLDKSVEVYGAADVVAHALYEMTFFGYCSKVVSKRVEEEKHILDERYDEIQSGTAQLIPFEEVMAETNYVDKRTPEEKEKEYRECERINAKNEKIYKMLLGR
ncbi:MAG: hypothetical protein M1475_07135 [Actinobacteria bacterium]|nr:hypothetical protein [Actinomycetota bacterium]